MTGAVIAYKTSPAGILAVSSDGKVTLSDASAPDQTIKVSATVTLGGMTYTSNALSVKLLAGKIAVQIQSDTDDMEEMAEGGDVDVASSDLELCQESPKNPAEPENQLVGLRFAGVSIPRRRNNYRRLYPVYGPDGGDLGKSTNPLDIKIYAEDLINTEDLC